VLVRFKRAAYAALQGDAERDAGMTAAELSVIGILALAIAAGAWWWRKRQNDKRVLREFKSVFFNLAERDRERIIATWRDRARCGRTEAMRLAVEDWRRGARSWR
jgi:hypothetical protein